MTNELQGYNFILGEQSSVLTTGTKAVKHFPWNMNLQETYVTLMTAPTVNAVTVDILKNGVSILTNKMTVAVGSYNSKGTELIKDTTVYESDQLAFVVLTTDVSASILEINMKYETFVDPVGSNHPVTPTVYSDIYTSSESIPEGVSYTNKAYVDNKRTDTYVADGSITRPYKTILAAVNAINTLSLAHQTANTFTQANYIIEVAPGTYSDNFTINNVKNLRFNMHGVYITGNITYTTTMVGGSADNYYARLEFVGCEGNRAEKGTSGRLLGTFTATRNNDSLCYVSFKGIHVAGNMLYKTNGTWILSMKDVFFSAYLYTEDLALVLLETTGHTEFGAYSGTGTGHISVPSTDTIVAVSLYNVDNTEFDLINISNVAGSRVTNCRFKSTTTITGGTVATDLISYKSLIAQTETLTGSTISFLEGLKPQVYQTLTSVSNATPMNLNLGVNGIITLAESTTITLSNLSSGDEGNIVVTQAAANYTVAISPTPYVINDGAGAVVITDGAGSITVLSYTYDGTRLFVTYGPNYTNS
jgi:hypothetical protein